MKHADSESIVLMVREMAERLEAIDILLDNTVEGESDEMRNAVGNIELELSRLENVRNAA